MRALRAAPSLPGTPNHSIPVKAVGCWSWLLGSARSRPPPALAASGGLRWSTCKQPQTRGPVPSIEAGCWWSTATSSTRPRARNRQAKPGTSAAIALIEHLWAIPLRDAIVSSGGTPVLDMWVHPLDLVAIGADTDDE